MKALAFTLLLTALFVRHASALPSCKESFRGSNYQFDFTETYQNFSQRLNRSSCEKDWTVLVYMAADNDLFPYALMDLYEMEAAFESGKGAGSTLKTDLVVQADGPKNNDLRRLHIYAGPVTYETKPKSAFEGLDLESVKSPIVEKLPETEQSEQARLTDFIKWSIKKYPAKNYFLVVWGHGQGWKSFPVSNPAHSRFLKPENIPKFPAASTDRSFGGIAFRQSSNTWLDIPGLRSALNTFQQSTGKPLDVYASDACLMQMLEVSYEMTDSTRFIVGSTQVQSFLGLPYRRIMYELNTGKFNGERRRSRDSGDAGDEAYLLAKMIPKLMKQSLDPVRGSQGRLDRQSQKYVTSSALSSSQLTNVLAPEVKELSKALVNYLKEDPLRGIDMQFVLQNTPAFEGGAQDFGVFLGLLDLLILQEKQQNGEISAAAAELADVVKETKTVLDQSILSYAYGSSYPQDDAQVVGFVPRAVSLWLPVSLEEYKKRESDFSSSKFYEQTGWKTWLALVYKNP